MANEKEVKERIVAYKENRQPTIVSSIVSLNAKQVELIESYARNIVKHDGDVQEVVDSFLQYNTWVEHLLADARINMQRRLTQEVARVKKDNESKEIV